MTTQSTDNLPLRVILARLVALTRPFWRGMAISIVLSAITIGSSVALMGTSAWLISKAALQPSIAALGVAPTMVRAFGVSRAFFRYLERLVSHNVTFRLLARLRVWFYSAIEPLAPARLARYRSGDLLGRVVADVEALENVFLRVIAPPIVALFIGLGTLIFLGLFDPWLVLVVFAFMLAASTGVPLLIWRTAQGPGRQVVAARADLNAALVDNIQGMADAVAYGQQAVLLAQMDAHNQDLARQEKRLALVDGFQEASIVLLTHLASVAVMVLAVGQVDGIMLGTLALVTVAAFEAFMPLAQAAHHMGSSAAAGQRLFEIVDSEPVVRDPEQPAALPDAPTLTVTDLRFAYDPADPPAIDGLSFTLTPGKKLAVVGPSGAGKSTLVNLLLRFYPADPGMIHLGQRDLADYAQDDIHSLMGVMSQRTHLFNTSIRENIAIARDGATEDDVIAAARRAQVHDFIAGLPHGYRTYVGEGGASLSGGERQRVALARMLLKQAQVMILDEATANLDPVTEREVLREVYDALDGQSLLVITHRLTLLDRMDEIIVVDGGRVVERGTHAELMAAGGLYRRMVTAQNRVLAEDAVAASSAAD